MPLYPILMKFLKYVRNSKIEAVFQYRDCLFVSAAIQHNNHGDEMNLSSSQRKYLRGLAHPLNPVVMVGHGGVSESVMAEVEQALNVHELIKIRFHEFKDEKETLCAEIVKHSDAAVAGIIGHVAILYRPQRDLSKRRIRLP